ncbi:MAG: hypothetical protein N3G74_01475 [Candidatus Micrarchaeota archaeon]|nr:hypothetical protein [Candidatus Micrarchaeota archaeon]
MLILFHLNSKEPYNNQKFSMPNLSSFSNQIPVIVNTTSDEIQHVLEMLKKENIKIELDDIFERFIESRELGEEKESEEEEEKEEEKLKEKEWGVEEEVKEKVKEAEERIIKILEESSERIAELIEQDMLSTENIKENIEILSSVSEYIGLKEAVEEIEEKLKEEKVEEAMEIIREQNERIREEADNLKEAIDKIEDLEKEKAGIGKISEELSKLTEKSHPLDEEIENISDALKHLKEGGVLSKEIADSLLQELKAKQKIHENIIKKIREAVTSIEKTPEEKREAEIKGLIKEIRHGITEIEALSRRIERITSEVVKNIEKEIDNFVPKFFRKEDLHEVIKKIWINSTIDFIRDKIMRASMRKESEERTEKRAKIEAEEKYWSEKLASLIPELNSPLHIFDRKLKSILKPAEYKEAVLHSHRALISYLDKFSYELEEIYVNSFVFGKKQLRVEQIVENLEKKAEALSISQKDIAKIENLLEKNDLKALSEYIDELKFSKMRSRILVKNRRRHSNSTSRMLIKDLLQQLYAANYPIYLAKSLSSAVKDGKKAGKKNSVSDRRKIEILVKNIHSQIMEIEKAKSHAASDSLNRSHIHNLAKCLSKSYICLGCCDKLSS